MDNASKALIIAGAVLISVMLVSIGVLIFNRATDTVNTALTEQDRVAIEMTNQKYKQYQGNSKNRTLVVELLSLIKQDYLANAEHTVEVTLNNTPAGNSTTVKPDSNNIDATIDKIQKGTNYTYNISFEKDASGYIFKCTIQGTSGAAQQQQQQPNNG